METVASSGSAVVSLPSDTEILITREFAAPAHLVYKAFTTPDLVKRWWSAKRGEVTIAEIDLRVGGKWRWVMVTDDGFEVAFHGEYREIKPNERIVHTEVYEGAPGGDENPALITMNLAEKDGHTILTLVTAMATKEGRDMILESRMEAGMQDAYDLLEEVAISLK
jgi:uncharacterized protein YndB with AHSA1/START domain